MSSVYVVGTFDTKGDELRYVAALIAVEGVPVTTVDVGTGAPGKPGAPRDPAAPGGTRGNGEPDVGVPAREVAAHHPDGAGAVFTGDRGRAVAAMAAALEQFARARADDIAGMIGRAAARWHRAARAGDARAARRRPKILVSTVASGDVAPYVGASDIGMVHSVTDVAGLNRISRRCSATPRTPWPAWPRTRAARCAATARRWPDHVRRHHALRDPGVRRSSRL